MIDDARAGRMLLWIVLAGMALRLVWALLVPVMPVSDSAAYDTFARNIVEHGTYGWTAGEPSAYWAVGTSAVTAATYFVLGQTYLGVVVLNLLASLAIIMLGERLGSHYFDRTTGLWTAAILAAWPNLILFVSILSSELWFIALTMGGLLAWERGRGPMNWTGLVLAGLLWGAACYMRPVILLLPVALAIASLFQGFWPLLRQSGRALVAIVLIVLVVLPWSLRNERVFGERVMVSTNFGANFWMGNNPDTQGIYMPLPDRVNGMGEIERSDVLKEEAMAYIRAEPMAFVQRTLAKAGVMHAWETVGVAWNQRGIADIFGAWAITPLNLLTTAYWTLVLLLAIGGLGLQLWRQGVRGLFHPVFGGWGYFTAVHAVIVAGDRYHMPGVPFMALSAALAMTWGMTHLKERSRA